MHLLRGTARVDRRTKNLVKRLQPNEIAIINHEDLDEVCAEALVEAKVKAVVNAAPSISGKYPNLGPLTLAEAGVYLLDNVGLEVLEKIREGDAVEIIGDRINVPEKWTGRGEILDMAKVK
ncbi:MAG: hypothetical protein FDZ75_08900, partial [Actinobacteria bacterium]